MTSMLSPGKWVPMQPATSDQTLDPRTRYTLRLGAVHWIHAPGTHYGRVQYTGSTHQVHTTAGCSTLDPRTRYTLRPGAVHWIHAPGTHYGWVQYTGSTHQVHITAGCSTLDPRTRYTLRPGAVHWIHAPGTYYGWVTLLYMTSTGTWTSDLVHLGTWEAMLSCDVLFCRKKSMSLRGRLW